MKTNTIEYVSYEELYLAYLDCRKRKRGTNNCTKFEMNLHINLFKLYKDLNSLQYEPGNSIVFLLFNKNKTPYREIFAADFRDRIVHHLIVTRILPYLEKYWYIDDNYSCRKGKGVLYGVKRLLRYINESDKTAYIAKFDIKNCFNSLNKQALYDNITSFLYTHLNTNDYIFASFILKHIIFNDPRVNCKRKTTLKCWYNMPYYKSMFNLDDVHGLAVGNLTTQIISGFYLTLLDNFIINTLKISRYGRYVDDFYIICNTVDEIKYAYNKIYEFLLSIGLVLSPNKIYIQPISHGINYIGYTIKPNRIYCQHKTINKFKHIMYSVKYVNSMAKLINFVNTYNSYTGFYIIHILTT